MSRLLVGLLLAAPVLPAQAIVTKEAYLPRDLVKVVRADLPDYLAHDCPDLADSIRTTWLRLNNAGWSVVIQGIRHCFAGANNGSYFVYTHAENGGARFSMHRETGSTGFQPKRMNGKI
jgi:hypothetical protein